MEINGLNVFNLTPHQISFSTVLDGRPRIIDVPPEDTPCRVDTEQHATGMINNILPTQYQRYGAVRNLPEPSPNTVYIVSGLVLHALRIAGSTRTDVVAPATGPRDNAMRNSLGHVLAVTTFNALKAA